MYSVQSYGYMIADRPRTDAYLAALKRAVRPGSVVIDIGTGTGYFAVAACRLGAARVYAIEPADAIAIARQTAGENGFSEKIQFFQDLSTRVTLPERADVIVSDLRGSLPFYSAHIPSLIDARTRLLKADGVLIPQKDRVLAALVEVPKIYADKIDVWRKADPEIRMEAARRVSANSRHDGLNYPSEQLLSAIQCWTTVDYRTVTSLSAEGEISFQAERSGTAHGIGMWFETLLNEEIGFALGPNGYDTVYGRPFFAFQEPVPVSSGDVITVQLKGDLTGDDYIWTWTTAVAGKVKFRQSTFFAATALSPQMLHRMASDHVPVLAEDGRVERFILDRMDGSLTVGQIADRLCLEFPQRFSDRREALTKVGTVSRQFSGGEPSTR